MTWLSKFWQTQGENRQEDIGDSRRRRRRRRRGKGEH